MSTENRELIVRKQNELANPETGTVEILFVSSNNGMTIELPSVMEFPTKGIFISKHFETIKDQFRDGELFRLQKWNDIEDSNSSYSTDDRHHHHWAYGSSAKSIEPLSLLPIYDGELPDLSTGYVDINNLPANKAFFIKNKGEIYGPFNADAKREDEKIKAYPYPQTVLSIPNNFVLKVRQSVLDNENMITPIMMGPDEQDEIQYIVSLRLLTSIQTETEQIDFTSDEQLIAYFSKLKLGKQTILSKKETEKLKQGVADAIAKKALKEDGRVRRLREILDKYLEVSDVGDELINDYFDSEKGKSFLNGYIESKPNLVANASKEIQASIEEHEGRLHQLQNDIQNKIRVQRESVEAEKAKATHAIEEAKATAEKEINEIRNKSLIEVQREQQEVLGTLQTEVINLESKKEELESVIVKFYDEQDSIKQYEVLQENIRYLTVRDKELSKIVEGLTHSVNSPDFGAKAAEVKTILGLLQGRSLDEGNEQYLFKSPPITSVIPGQDQAAQYIQTIVEYFENDNYSITFEEITNLLINIQQSFLTVLSGLPGSGKTSSVTRLSAAHGLYPENKTKSDCFLNIPVARGWVSSRDFVGFNNSLKGLFQPAKTGLYQFLRQSEQPEADKLLRMVLLDEANLSPIEHYWSEFLAMCDKEGRNRPLDTGIQGDKRFLKVENNIRFIATINNDNTTEPLSPRLCDRVPVITMMDLDLRRESVSQPFASLSLDGGIPYLQLEEWFGISNDSNLITPPLIEEFCGKMKASGKDLGAEIYVSHRKINAMTEFYGKAIKYIEQSIAIDFAISQHALPLINGHGKDFRKRLENLEEMAKNNNLERTGTLLQKILKSGDMYIDSYSFF